VARGGRAKKGRGPSGVREGRLEAVVRGATVYNSCRRPRANRPCPQLPQSCLNLASSHGHTERSSVVRGAAERMWVTRSRSISDRPSFFRPPRLSLIFPVVAKSPRRETQRKEIERASSAFRSPIVYPPRDSARVP
jgi:hypothetical protein